jgi:hypothetical protein
MQLSEVFEAFPMRRMLLILTFALLTNALYAQNTWGDLRFGQTRDNVRDVLSQQNISVTTSQDGTLRSDSDYSLWLPGLTQALPVVISVHFDTSSHLSDVTLSLDVAGMRGDWGVHADPETLSTFSAEKLTGALSGRYGAPLYRSSVCDSQPTNASPFCIVSWRGENQTVELQRSTSADGPRLLVRYQPLATNL